MAVEKFVPDFTLEPPTEEVRLPGEAGGCASKEPYALMVLGDSMEPEFMDGEIIVIEPGRTPQEGSFVIAWHEGEHIFRQLVRHGEGWYLKPLNDAYPTALIDGLDAVRGVIIQKQGRGGRRDRKFYS